MDRRKFLFSSLVGIVSSSLLSFIPDEPSKEDMKKSSLISIKCYRNVRTGQLYHYKGEIVQVIDLFKEPSNDYVILTLLPAKQSVDIGAGKGREILYHYCGDLDLKFYGYTCREEAEMRYNKIKLWVTAS